METTTASHGDPTVGLMLILLLAVAYFLPFLVALIRSKRNKVPILIVNLFFGWTLLGWVIALVWAFAHDAPIAPVHA